MHPCLGGSCLDLLLAAAAVAGAAWPLGGFLVTSKGTRSTALHPCDQADPSQLQPGTREPFCAEQQGWPGAAGQPRIICPGCTRGCLFPGPEGEASARHPVSVLLLCGEVSRDICEVCEPQADSSWDKAQQLQVKSQRAEKDLHFPWIPKDSLVLHLRVS